MGLVPRALVTGALMWVEPVVQAGENLARHATKPPAEAELRLRDGNHSKKGIEGKIDDKQVLGFVRVGRLGGPHGLASG